MFTVDRAMIPKPKFREMDLENPNKPPEVIESVEDSKAPEENTFTLDQSETYGNPAPNINKHTETWPEISYCRQYSLNRSGLRIREI